MGTTAWYAIRIRGRLSSDWSVWFDGMTCTSVENGDTLLAGPVADQAALYGLLARIRNLNLTLLSVERVRENEV